MGFRDARIAAGKSVKDVMVAMGVSDAAVYCWETGQYKPQTETLIKLADFYGTTIDALLRGNNNDG